MSYKTPEQMLNVIIKENLLTDACMTILEGRNDYGFHAVKVPDRSVTPLGNGEFKIELSDGQNDIEAKAFVKDTSKTTSFWLVSFDNNKYQIISVQHDKEQNDKEINKKEYLSMIAMFLDHYKVGTKMRLIQILKNGYSKLKKEINDNENPYELIRDYMDAGLLVTKVDAIPQKYNVRFNFMEGR